MATINGTSGNDTLIGTAQADTIHGNGGNDQIAGGSNNDTLYGDDGDDLILGEQGNDIIWGGAGADLMSGGIGSDTVHGGAGNDDIYFGTGDSLYGDDGEDWFIAEEGYGTAFTVLDGGTGIDLVDFRNATQALTLRMNDAVGAGQWLNNVEVVVLGALGGTVHGGSIAELMIGGAGADTFNGGGGADELLGDAGNDILNGGAGDDYIDAGYGDDVIDGGDGVDTLNYTFSSSSFHVDLSLTGPQDTHYGMDTISGIENVMGGDGADVLRGDGANNRLEGGAWDDVLAGGGGDDILMGGEGRDTVDYSRATAGVTVSLANQGVAVNTGGDGIDTLSGFESITGSAFDDVLTGDGADMNEFRGGGGSDRIDGGAGFDTAYYEGWAQAGDTTSANLIRDVWKDITGTVFVRTADGEIDTLISVDTVAFDNFNYPALSLRQIGIVHQGTAAAETLWGDMGRDEIRGGGGNDVIHGGPADRSYDTDDTLYGEGGDDQLFGDGGTDILYGGDGNDRLQGGDYGRNQMYGGAGNDTYVLGDHPNTPDEIHEYAGEGTDTILLDGTTGGIAANVENLIWLGTHDGTGYYTGVFGNSLNNTITGNVGHNDISGEGGSDVISAGDGNDRIWAEGRDQYSAVGIGNDIIHGDGGADIIYGGAGADQLFGDDGADVVTGGAGNDAISGGAGVDDLSGGEGNDAITGGADGDTLKGDAGADTLTGGAGNDTLDGGADLDVAVYAGLRSAYTVTVTGPTVTVTGPDGTDTLTNIERLRFSDQEMSLAGLSGTEDADTMPGTTGDDYLYGAGGDDILMGTAGNDVFDGGDGSDAVDYRNATGAVTVNLALATGQAVGGGQNTDTFASIENLIGSAHADRLTGNAEINRLEGGNGDDILDGGTGQDALLGGAGQDTLVFNRTEWSGYWNGFADGGAGTDILDASGVAGSVRIANDFSRFQMSFGSQMNAGGEVFIISNIETFITGQGADYLDLYYTDAPVTVRSGDGNDIVYGSAKGSTIDAGAGDDEIGVGGPAASFVHAGAGNDRVSFGLNDSVFGDEGDDVFLFYGSPDGSAYATLNGGTGNDTIRLFEYGSVNLTTGVADRAGTRFAQVTSIENVDVIVGFGIGAPIIGSAANNVIQAVSLGSDSSAVDFSGLAGDDVLRGDRMNDRLNGGEGDDTLVGGNGNDLIDGGDGSDTAVFSRYRSDYVVTVNGDVITVTGPEGADTLTGIEWLQFADQTMEIVRPMTLVGSAGDDTLVGNALNDTLTGGDGNDVLRGRGGVDVLTGGAGIDTADYSTAAAGMRAQLNTNVSSNDGDGGTDTFSGIENLTGSAFNDILIGDGAVNVLRGGLGSDTLIGLGGNDVLWGGSGVANSLSGGLGDDWYVLEANDSVVEASGEGNDTVEARINTYVLAANVETLIFTGTGDFFATGHSGASTITGGAGNDNLRGRGGVDVLNGGAGIDTVDYSLAASGVTARLDTMRATNDGDGSTDNFSGIENLTGSIYNDVLLGNGANNVLMGGVGVDVLAGYAGNDVLYGGPAGGNNQLIGGLGDDWYVLDAIDTCVELVGEGMDTVEARIGAYVMRENIENLIYTGANKFVGTGNALDNHMTGGALNDVLRGMGGSDTILGGMGNDELQVRGAKAQYTVTAEGDGWRIDDMVEGRDGTIYVESIETVRFLTGNTTTGLTYPPPASAPLETSGKDTGPEVLPGLIDDTSWDDAFVLPAMPDDEPMVLPGLEAHKFTDAPLVLPGAGEAAPDFFGLAAHLPPTGDWMIALDPEGGLFSPHGARTHDWM